MNVFLLILAGIIVIILLLLFLPFTVRVTYNDKVKIQAGLVFPFINIPVGEQKNISPRKAAKAERKKQKKEEKKKRAKEKKRLREEKRRKKALAKGIELPEEEKKENLFAITVREEGVSGLIELLTELLRILLGPLKKIADHLVISKMELQIAVASDNAAQTAVLYGHICSVVYTLINLISSRVKKCSHKERISPDFTSEKTRVYFELKARIQIFFILSGVLKAGLKTLKLFASKKAKSVQTNDPQ